MFFALFYGSHLSDHFQQVVGLLVSWLKAVVRCSLNSKVLGFRKSQNLWLKTVSGFRFQENQKQAPTGSGKNWTEGFP